MSSTADQREGGRAVTATADAAEQARELMDGEGMDETEAGLRLYVQQGGCAGLSYGMRFEHEPEDDDEIFESNGIRLFVDQSSLNYVAGSQLAYEGGLQGAGFHVQNPNVESECGCGESFRT
ncbi:MAG: HesB/IscA family protein [Halobacterium sp.]